MSYTLVYKEEPCPKGLLSGPQPSYLVDGKPVFVKIIVDGIRIEGRHEYPPQFYFAASEEGSEYKFEADHGYQELVQITLLRDDALPEHVKELELPKNHPVFRFLYVDDKPLYCEL